MGFIDEWYRDAKAIMFHPKEFFKTMATTGGYWEPFKCAFFNIVVAAVLTTGISIILTQYYGYSIRIPPLIGMFLNLIFVSMGLFVSAAIIHVILKLAGAKKNYEATFRIVAYLSLFEILLAVPLIMLVIEPLLIIAVKYVVFVISFYIMYLMVTAFNKVHKITVLRSIIAVVLILAVSYILILIVTRIFVDVANMLL